MFFRLYFLFDLHDLSLVTQANQLLTHLRPEVRMTNDDPGVPFFSFHVSIHARPPGLELGSPIHVRGREVTPLRVTPESLRVPMAASFEQAARRLERLPRMFLEPDGSFVWVSSAHQRPWQVDGVLYDRDDHLLFVDVKGECPAEAWHQLLEALGSKSTPLMFQLVREAVFVDHAGFERVCRLEKEVRGDDG